MTNPNHSHSKRRQQRNTDPNRKEDSGGAVCEGLALLVWKYFEDEIRDALRETHVCLQPLDQTIAVDSKQKKNQRQPNRETTSRSKFKKLGDRDRPQRSPPDGHLEKSRGKAHQDIQSVTDGP